MNLDKCTYHDRFEASLSDRLTFADIIAFLELLSRIKRANATSSCWISLILIGLIRRLGHVASRQGKLPKRTTCGSFFVPLGEICGN